MIGQLTSWTEEVSSCVIIRDAGSMSVAPTAIFPGLDRT
jgi:hypothetical protein